MRILLVGLGRFGTEIAKRLLTLQHELLIIESDPTSVEKFVSENPSGNYKICVGDASSLLVWEYLNLEGFDLVVSSLRSNDFNKTLCGIVREIFQNLDIPVVVYATSHRYEEYFANFNCKVFYIPELASAFVEGLTLKGINKPIGIGLGKNEILEVSVSPKSPYAGVWINWEKHKHWRIALIYRGEKIILPGRKVKLRAGDRVLLVGDSPRIVFEVAQSMALGKPQFPLSFGENLLTFLEEKDLHYLKEFYFLWKHTRLKQVVLFTNKPESLNPRLFVEDKNFLENLKIKKGKNYDIVFNKEFQVENGAGVVSVPHKRRFLFLENVSLRDFFNSEIPFLLPRLSFPYRKILVSLNTENPSAVLEQCFELAQLLKAEKMTFFFAALPEVLEPASEKKKFEEAAESIAYYSKLFGMRNRVELVKEEGNPVKKTLKVLRDYDLLVVPYKPHSLSLLEPYTPYLLAKNCDKSVLGIPTER